MLPYLGCLIKTGREREYTHAIKLPMLKINTTGTYLERLQRGSLFLPATMQDCPISIIDQCCNDRLLQLAKMYVFYLIKIITQFCTATSPLLFKLAYLPFFITLGVTYIHRHFQEVVSKEVVSKEIQLPHYFFSTSSFLTKRR